MSRLFVSYEQAIDDALIRACGILAVVSAPAYLVGAYRSLLVDFAPVHLATISFVWLSFFILSLRKLEVVTLRYNLIIVNFLILFAAVSFKNQSVIV